MADGELVVPMDETQLQQVLMNLCLNARDAMPDGGRLRVWAETVADPGDATAPWVRLSVADDGCGMSGRSQARIFDPFFSTKERGTGLGLAVVRQIVEGGGGRVEVHSEPGHGSRFEVWLPTRPHGGGRDRRRRAGGLHRARHLSSAFSSRLPTGNAHITELSGAPPPRRGDGGGPHCSDRPSAAS